LWGIGRTTIAKWRRALEVTRKNNEGSQVLIHAATAKALAAARKTELSPEEHERRGQLILEVQPWRFGPRVTYGKEWTAEAIALLGTMPDPEVARLTGHTINAVRIRRKIEGIPRFPASEPVGASFEPRTGRWCAQISVGGKRVSLGTYDTKKEAHQAYQEAICRYRG
jgi:hypothetical protein